MKIFVQTFLIGFLMFAVAAQAQDDTAKFRYRKNRNFPVGTVLHYVKTNIDGTKPERVSQFIAAENKMESFKFHPNEPPAGLVIAEMDWHFFSAKVLKSWRILSKTERTFFGTILFDGAKREAEVSIPAVKTESEFVKLEHFPVHLYNFDFGSLNFAFPHLVKPKKAFTIGVADPTFRENAALVEYKGKVEISYAGEEKRGDVLTRKYKIDCAGLQNRGGFIWVNKKRNWIEDMEIQLPDNPEWTSFKFKLLKTEKMNRAEWEKFIISQL